MLRYVLQDGDSSPKNVFASLSVYVQIDASLKLSFSSDLVRVGCFFGVHDTIKTVVGVVNVFMSFKPLNLPLPALEGLKAERIEVFPGP